MLNHNCKSFSDAWLMALLIAAVGLLPNSQAQISVGVSGSATETFTVAPSFTNWTSLSITGSASVFQTTAMLDAAVQVRAASGIPFGVNYSTANPPSAASLAVWSSTGSYLQTQATGGGATLLMATLRNDSGGQINSFLVSYSLTINNAIGAEEIPGHRIYYSLSGAAGSWVAVGNYSTAGQQIIPVNLPGQWNAGGKLYILWADDNSISASPDDRYQINDFSITTVNGFITSPVFRTQPQSQTHVPGDFVTLSASVTGTAPVSYQWRKNGTNIVGATGSVLHLSSFSASDVGSYSVVASNAVDSRASSVAHLTLSSPPQLLTYPLIDFDTNNVWKYSTQTNLFGTGWESVGYNDSTWLSGPSGLGLNLDSNVNGVPIRTVIPYSGRSEPQFFRRHFNLPSANGVSLVLRDVVEDGAVYFINGQVVFWRNVFPGALSAASRAIVNQLDPTPIQGPFVFHAPSLVAGDNVIAVAVLQNGATSSDIELAVELMAVVGGAVPAPPIFTIQPQSQTVTVGSPVALNVATEAGGTLTYQWRKNGAIIQTSPNYGLNFVAASVSNAGLYSVVVSDGINTATSSVAQLNVLSPLPFTTTTLTPATALTTPAVLFPPSASQLKTYVSGNFVANAPLDSGRMTVVLTHGWNSNPNEWATNMADSILNHVAVPPNIVAWDWTEAAASFPCKSWQADLVPSAKQTPEQGHALGRALTNALLTWLNPNYSQPIHFIGHSLGTMVNGHAADFLHAHGFAPANTHMTLFDEAEAAKGLGCLGAVSAVFNLWDPLSPQPYWYRPIPSQSVAWIDNYVSFAGLLHPEARNVVLTNHFPRDGLGGYDWYLATKEFHSYPYRWYGQTITNPFGSVMGYRRSFEQGGFVGAPATNDVYVQSGSELNLVPTNFAAGNSLINERIQKYRTALRSAFIPTQIQSAIRNGGVTGESQVTGPGNAWNLLLNLRTSSGGAGFAEFLGKGAQAGGGNGTNTPAYVWITLAVPSNSISMAFDYVLQGDGRADSFAAAVNGTNVMSLATSLIETNVTSNSGLIDVSPWAGQQIELFLGIVGGTSTNASLTVSGFRFYSPELPSLQAQANGTNVTVTWPLSADGYVLESSMTLGGTNAWTAVTNLPVIVNFQNSVTNTASGSSKFFRLKKP